MILCLDCGNTRLKWGLLKDDGTWQARGALELDNLATLTSALAGQPAITQVHGCIVSSPEHAAIIASQLPIPVRWVIPSQAQCGVRNGYRNIKQLGLDRWVGLIAARSLHKGACLVVNAGTATTVDLLDADGTFRGGLILPGLDLMRQSLALNTARLPMAEAAYTPLPTDTEAAIVGGALEATVGAIERMFTRLSGPDALCLLTGGAAPQLAPLLQIRVQSVDDLVLRGLAQIALNPSV